MFSFLQDMLVPNNIILNIIMIFGILAVFTS